jgi:pyruvate dehydrogenase E2 component (dihydrolipoyllysine-residue acetyltransferase)
MATNVMMPQMGESIAEGTIVRWIKKVGDQVDRDEPLFEISTGKVDAEIPAPAAGVLTDIKVKEGETVPVNSVVAVIGGAGEAVSAPEAPAAGGSEPALPQAAAGQPEVAPGAGTAEVGDEAEDDDAHPSTDDLRRQRSSPLVRRIAKEHDVDIRLIKGTGISGRVTKQDILGFIESGKGRRAPAGGGAAMPAFAPGESVKVVPMSVMRRKIAEHMVMSKRTSPHVHSAFEIDFTKVDEIRKSKKADYEKASAKLTYMSFITKACAAALKAVPVVNASVDGADILYKKEINIGVAVALDWGLIVPVVKNADMLSLVEISKAIADLAGRARDKKLKPEEVQGGTFTITNPGVFGALFGMPIISQPQVAIVGVGAVEKRPVVVDDAVTVRLRAYMTIGYDHRIIDGAVADEFMQHVKKMIENWNAGDA